MHMIVKNMLSFLLSMVLTVVLTPLLIKFYRKRNQGQMIREKGPEWQVAKNGTPTMGGLVFVCTVIFSSIFTNIVFHITGVTVEICCAFLLFGLIGYIDDSIKLKKREIWDYMHGKRHLYRWLQHFSLPSDTGMRAFR